MLIITNVADTYNCSYKVRHNSFFTLPQVVQQHFDNAAVALRDLFNNQNLIELHMIEFERARFDALTIRPDQFLVQLQTLAKQVLRDPMLLPVAPAETALGQADVDRVAR